MAQAWYLHGTAINLHFNDSSVQGREFITDDVSYTYENGRWGRYLIYGWQNVSGAFGVLVDQFLATSAPPPYADQFGATQQAIANEMYAYLWTYGVWATNGWFKGGSSSSQQGPDYRGLSEDQARLNSFSYNILQN